MLDVLQKMKKRHAIVIFSTIVLIGAGIWAFGQWRVRTNPYKDDGLTIRWDVGGATPAYSWIEVSVDHDGKEIRPDLAFGGIEYPRLRFRDYDSDGRRDIIFEDDQFMQAIAFFPAANGEPPRFEILRNDVTWP